MKSFSISACIIVTVVGFSCADSRMCRDSGATYVDEIRGTLRFDERFERYVVDDVLEGSIDARKLYIICDASSVSDISQFLDDEVSVSGQVHTLVEDLEPDLVVAGEEFLVLSSVAQFSRVQPN